MNKTRCPWPGDNPEMIVYHDTEWGRPCFNDAKVFEYFLLDTFQAGLSWDIILRKRNSFKKAFSNFNVTKVAQYSKKDEKRLLGDSGIIRNKRKIQAAITNAKKILELQKEFGSFAKYLWNFTSNKTLDPKYKKIGDIPTTSKEAIALSKDLKKRGFGFVGPTTMYAFMQGIGMTNDHLISCFTRRSLAKAGNPLKGPF